MARKGILTPGAAPAPRKSGGAAPRGTVGALQSSLARLQDSAVREVDADQIDVAGFEDRLGLDPGAQAELVRSIREHGQQVPVLLRPHPEREGRFEIVYGRRRLMALREIGRPVKAMVRQLDDHALAIAQGQENTARQDLSFVEKASFAAQLDAAGYDRKTLAAALSIDLPMVSRMLKVGHAFPLPFLRRIGSAPAIGRARWMELATLFGDVEARSRAERAAEEESFDALDTNARFEDALAAARGDRAVRDPVSAALPREVGAGAKLRRAGRALTITIPTKDGFADWLDANAEAVFAELQARWKDGASKD